MNLLPEEEKNNLRRDYRLKLYTLAIYFLAGAFVLGAVPVIPYYISGKAELERMASEAGFLGDEKLSSTTKKTIEEFTDFTHRLSLLDGPANSTSTPSVVLTEVLTEKPAKISVTSFSYIVQEKPKGFIQVVVSGVAGDRDSLLLFTKKLSDKKIFNSVDLPVSNFSKKTDIDFSINLTLTRAEENDK